MGDFIYDQILIHANLCAPFGRKCVRSSQPGWYSVELLEKAIERGRLYCIARKSKNESDFDKRNEVKTDIENARSSYYIDRVKKHSDNPKRFWGDINSLISPVNSKGVTNIFYASTGTLANTEKSADLVKGGSLQ